MERHLWPFDYAGSGSAVRQVPQLPPGQPCSRRSGSSEHHSTQPGITTLDRVLVSPTRLRAVFGVRRARPAFVQLTVSTTWALRIMAISVFSEMLPGASTGHHHNRQSSEALTSLAQTESPRDSTSPLPTLRVPDRFRTSSLETSCRSMCRATTTTTRPWRPSTINFSIQRQLDKSTVLTVAYVGTLGHHVEHGET